MTVITNSQPDAGSIKPKHGAQFWYGYDNIAEMSSGSDYRFQKLFVINKPTWQLEIVIFLFSNHNS